MKNRHFVILAISAIVLVTVAGFFASSFFSENYVKAATPFFNSLVAKDFENARQNLFVLTNADSSLFADEKLSSISMALKSVLGENFTVKFDRSQKVVSSNPAQSTPEGTTKVYFDLISNDKFIEVECLINDQSQKIQYINFSSDPKKVPDFVPFIVLSVLFLFVPILNLIAIIKIRSNYANGRIWRYLTVLLLNLPTVTYFAAGSINFNLLASQFFFGYSLDLSGFSQASVSIGIPLGSLFWIFTARLKRQVSGLSDIETARMAEAGITWECPKCHESNPNSTFQCLKCKYSLK